MARLREPKWPQLLIVSEKHATYYFHITSREELHAVSLDVLSRRNEDGYWYPQKEHTYADQERGLQSAIADLEAVGKGEGWTAYDTLKTELAIIQRWRRHEEESNRQREEIDGAIATGDGELAFAVLSSRADYEYEGFRLESYDERRPN